MISAIPAPLCNKEGRTRFSWLRSGYELVTKKRNQVMIEQYRPEIARGGGYEVVTPSVTGVTLGVGMHNATLTTEYQVQLPECCAFFFRTRCKARRLIKT
jgi:hypothetical protein